MKGPKEEPALSPGREQDCITKDAGSREQGITHKSWQPAQISSSLNCNPTHSHSFGEGTKSPQGVGLDAVHIGKWWGWVQSQDMGTDRDREKGLTSAAGG